VSDKRKKDETVLALAGAAGWRKWLAGHLGREEGVWLRLAKGGGKGLTYKEAVEAALAWGWIDSQARPMDEKTWLQRYSPRRATSPWSKINRAKAEALIAAAAMEAPGLAEVERAKKDGRWERAYDGARASRVPQDLAAALKRNARARAFFEKLDGANRYAILWRVQTAKNAKTRAERIVKFVGMCARGEVIHPKRVRKKASGRPSTRRPVKPAGGSGRTG
jgi:uncharacterized protein YdeI (YjbR/CyaY-like superfamily)